MILFIILFALNGHGIEEHWKVDFKERVQYSINSEKMVRFEYCKLDRCQLLGQEKRQTLFKHPLSPTSSEYTGLTNQILMDVSSNYISAPDEYQNAVAGIIIDDPQWTAVICSDKEIIDKIKNAKKPADYIMTFGSKLLCSRHGGNISIRKEANAIRSAITKFVLKQSL